jgi:hypothetical protein
LRRCEGSRSRRQPTGHQPRAPSTARRLWGGTIVVVNADRPTVALVLDGPGGDAAFRRLAAASPHVVVLAEPDPRDLPEARDVVVARRPGVRAVVAEMVRRDAWWGAVPDSVAAPDRLLADLVAGAGQHLDPEHPGLALVVTRAARAGIPYRRALVVVETRRHGASGFGAWVGAVLALHLGVAVDVLLLGVGEDVPLATPQQRLDQLLVTRHDDFLRLALRQLDAAGVEVGWLPGGRDPDRVASVEARVASGAYDVVVDDVADVRIRRTLGRRRDLRRLLRDPGRGAVPRWLLTHADTDVVLVVDAVTLGLLPAGAATTAGITALALGTLGVGWAGPVAARPERAAPVAASAASLDPGGSGPTVPGRHADQGQRDVPTRDRSKPPHPKDQPKGRTGVDGVRGRTGTEKDGLGRRGASGGGDPPDEGEEPPRGDG